MPGVPLPAVVLLLGGDGWATLGAILSSPETPGLTID